MKRDVRALIYDIQHSIASIEGYLEGVSFEFYADNEMLRDATERNFITIGEAIRRMRLLGEDVSSRMRDIAGAADFRNILVHEYENVNNERVWQIAKTSLPILKQQIDLWAEELGMERLPKRTG